MSEAEQTLTKVTEGKAEIVLPSGVFYNPVQEFNRDLTVAIICGYQKLHQKAWEDKRSSNLLRNQNQEGNGSQHEEYKGIRILEALAASGLRSTRFALEVPGVKDIVANDVDPTAAELIAQNAKSNGPETERLIKPMCMDANLMMMESRMKYEDGLFDVIDLDPYGSAAKFLPATLSSVANGGLLCITCTDAAVLCGSASGTSFGRYGGVTVRTSASHEIALRTLLHSIQHHAAVEGRSIQPILSLSADFYFRVYVRVFKGAGEAKLAACRSMMVYLCTGCRSHHFQPLGRAEPRGDQGNVIMVPARGPPVGPKCDTCGGQFNIAGPMWSEELHNREFIGKLLSELRKDEKESTMEVDDAIFAGIFDKAKLKTKDRIIGVLSMAAEELPDAPLYYRPEHLSKILHCHVPPLIKLRSAILNAGFQVSSTHTDPLAFKTTAPPDVIWDIFRAWVKESPIRESHLKESSPCSRILSVEPKIEVSFDLREDANPDSRKEGLLRFQPNPEKFWGPKSRAKRHATEGLEEKQKRLQGKRKGTNAKELESCDS